MEPMDPLNQQIRMVIGNLTVENLALIAQRDQLAARVNELQAELVAKATAPATPTPTLDG